jgi:HTH-type transcriptional regulator / antitoxin HipB
MNLIDIGVALAAARKAAGRSQAELAGSLRLSRATISGIENGTIREIGIRKVLALCAALGLELSASARRARPTLQELREEHRGGKTRA